tara:strand:- start:921 stop:1304 length:384 start_codon:yes stop_codon:yes gene_type:complete
VSELKENVFNWIATGRVGSSSKAMAMTACGMPSDKSYPSDPDDFNRCLLMLAEVPEVRQHFDKIADLGVVWGRLIERWDEIEKSFIDEAGLNWSSTRSAPLTYKLMKEVIGKEPGVVRLGGVSYRTR